MSALTLVERIEAMWFVDDPITRQRKANILADVRELESMLREIVFDNDVVGGRWPDTMVRARAILTKCAKESTT